MPGNHCSDGLMDGRKDAGAMSPSDIVGADNKVVNGSALPFKPRPCQVQPVTTR